MGKTTVVPESLYCPDCRRQIGNPHIGDFEEVEVNCPTCGKLLKGKKHATIAINEQQEQCIDCGCKIPKNFGDSCPNCDKNFSKGERPWK